MAEWENGKRKPETVRKYDSRRVVLKRQMNRKKWKAAGRASLHKYSSIDGRRAI